VSASPKYYVSADEEPEPQLIAHAIAAFQQNNRTREGVCRPPLESQTFPAITITGTASTFYKITVTRELSKAVEGGIYPKITTTVRKFVPPVAGYPAEGMVPLEDRRLLFKCYEAFKQFVVSPSPQ
jgi:hypothetical protein